MLCQRRKESENIGREREREEEGGRVGDGSGWGIDVRRTKRDDSRMIE